MARAPVTGNPIIYSGAWRAPGIKLLLCASGTHISTRIRACRERTCVHPSRLCSPYASSNDERASRRKTAQISRVNDARPEIPPYLRRETRFFSLSLSLSPLLISLLLLLLLVFSHSQSIFEFCANFVSFGKFRRRIIISINEIRARKSCQLDTLEILPDEDLPITSGCSISMGGNEDAV